MAKQERGEAGSNLICARGRKETLEAIFRTPLLYEPGTKTKYSDVDYMLLGFIVEKITGERLDAYVKRNFYEPLKLTHTTYLPLENGFTAEDCAATELNGNTRDRHISFPGIREETLQGLDEETDISGQLMDLLADMAAESLKLIPEGAGAEHPYVKNALSKIDVLKKWAEETGKTEYMVFAEELAEKTGETK